MDPIDWNCANNAFKNGMRGITVQNFLDMYNQTPTEPPILRQMLECEGNPCQLPDNCEGSTTDAFEGFCASYCLSYTPIATGGDGKVYIKKDECTENGSGCCLYKRNHCYCKATGEVLVRETITPAQGDCVPERRPIPSCPPGFYFYQSDCMVNCP
ncbi:MAG: hypothetical protein EPN82_05965 [Bacteroidetes bacterium]|nr:MAG: hypothetical protein EPN82_05965 [Bacteroidota bacterium]